MGARADAMSAAAERDALLSPARADAAENGAADTRYDATGKSLDEIEQDIAETRGQLGAILDELEHQLAPRHLLERGVDMLKDTMSGDGSGLAETLRRHPVPLALLGLGVGWMAVSVTTGRGGRLGEPVSDALQDAGQRASALAAQVRKKVAGATSGDIAEAAGGPYPTEEAGYAYARQKSGEAMGKARRTAQHTTRRARAAAGTAWDKASDYVGKAGDTLQGTGDRLTQLIEEHPIAVGALGILAGAVMAALLPRSDAEERLVGPAGEQIRDSAANLGRAATDVVRDAVSEAGAQTKSDSSV